MDFGILYFIDKLHSPVLDKIMIALTTLGDNGIFWIGLAIVLLFFKKTRKCGFLMLIAMAVGLLIGNGILKNLVRRDRPCWLDTSVALLIPLPKDFSFPSGHTLASFEAAVMIFLHNKKWGIASIALASAIAFSRLYLFVHFPTDILGGLLLGTGISLAVYYIFRKMQKQKSIKRDV